MELLNPVALAALALAIPLTALWFRRRQRTSRAVPSLQLWRAVKRTLPPQTGLRRLLVERSWWLHLAALALAALALAAPSLRARAEPAQRLVLVVDTTASMAARDGRRARIDEARALARRALDGLPRGAEVSVVEAGCAPALAVPVTREISLARTAIDALGVRACGGDLSRATVLGVDRARGAGRARVVVITDGVTRADALPTLPARVERVRVGRPVANVGITAAELRLDDEAPGAVRRGALFVGITAAHLAAPREITLRAELLRGDAAVPVARRRLRVAEGRSAVTLPLDLAEDELADLVAVSLEHPEDALDLDDVAWAPVPRGARIAVRLVRDGASPWITRALRADPAVTVEPLTAAQWRARTGRFDGLTVFHRAVPPEAVSGASLGFVGDAQGPRALGFALGPTLSRPAWTDVSETDPRVRFVGVADVHVPAARRVEATPSERVLLSSSGGPLIAARDDAAGTATLVGFDPDRTDWPLRPGFVLFLRDAVEHARARRDALRLDARRTGARVVIPATGDSVRISQGDVSRVIPVHEGAAAWTQTDRVGLWTVRRGRGDERVALSLLDPVESALEVAELSGAQPVDEGTVAPPRVNRALGWIAALLALLALLVEGALFARGRGAR